MSQLSSDPDGRRKPDESSVEVWNVVERADGKRRPSLGARLSRGGLGVPDENLIWFIRRADETYVTLMLWKPSAASVPPKYVHALSAAAAPLRSRCLSWSPWRSGSYGPVHAMIGWRVNPGTFNTLAIQSSSVCCSSLVILGQIVHIP